MLLAVLAANLAWLLRRRPTPGSPVERPLRRIPAALLQAGRLLYYVGIPCAALLFGGDALVERYLGIRGDLSGAWLDWMRALGWTAAMGAGTWLLLLAGRRAYRRALPGTDVGNAGNVSGWLALREAIYHEVHWAFYRNAPLVATLKATGDEYWGAWLGLALVALEATLNPAWRRGVADPQWAPQQLTRAALAVVSSALFLLIGNGGNLWMAIALHWAVTWNLGTGRLRPERPPARSIPPAAPRR